VSPAPPRPPGRTESPAPRAAGGASGPDGAAIGGRLLEASELAKLASLSIRARVIVEGAFSGLHHNRHAGSSIEFAEHKEYAPGDDIRHIDWKAVARVGRYYVKRFEDDTEMRTYLALDASASMGYGRSGVSKLELGGMLCAALAYLLGQQGDPAGLVVFDDRTRSYLPPRTRPGHIRDLLAVLEAAVAAGGSAPAQALGEIAEIAERRSLVLLFSDLLDAPDELGTRLRQLRAHGHDVTVFHVLDADEIELPGQEITHFEGVEPGDRRTLLADPSELRLAFRRESQAFRERWRARCVDARVEYHLARTDQPPAEVLRAFLTGRQGRATAARR
jgi:uncharacterized protein (DUF58 family)